MKEKNKNLILKLKKKKVKLLGFEYRPFYNLFSPFYEKGIREEAIILYGYCNFNCIYCKRRGCFKNQNGSIINAREFNLSEIYDFIEKQENETTMIRVSGGEPLIAPSKLLDYIFEKAKRNNFVVSIATNMSLPKRLERILPKLDYLAGDFKASKRYWEKVTKMPLDFYFSTKLSWIKWAESKADGEIRINIFPFTNFDDVKEIMDFIIKLKRVPTIVFRAFRSVSWLNWPSTSNDHIIDLAEKTSKFYTLPIIVRLHWKKGTLIISEKVNILDTSYFDIFHLVLKK